MKQNSADLKKLFNEKKYSEIINIIENKISKKDRNSGLLNLLGVCRLLEKNNASTLYLAIKDFRESYLKEKNTPNAFHALKNFINASMDLFDYEFRSNEKNLSKGSFDEIFLYFNENKEHFEKDKELTKSIIRVFKRYLDIDRTIFYLKKIIDNNQSDIDALSSYIYFNNFRNDWSQEVFLKYSKILNDRLKTFSEAEIVDLKKSENNKINLAFLSSDIRAKHSITSFLKTVLINYDKEKFNITLYVNNKEDETTKEFEKYVYKLKNISKMNDIDAINLIRSDRIDIIVDLMGFTSNHRLTLLKNRVAHKQVLWCGYCNTSGIKEVDYLVSDKNLVYKEEENLYSEKIIFLNDIWNCHSGFLGERKFNPAPSIINKHVTFGSFNNFRKINDKVIEVWSYILKQIPNSKLILKTSDASSTSQIIEKFKKNNVISSIQFEHHKKSLEKHLDDYKKIDIALDTFPYNGVTTSFEAIWMGVPTITMKGYNFNSRCGESINKNIGLDNLIAQNEKDYVEKAKLYALETSKLSELRSIIHDKALKSPLFDTKRFANDFFTSLEKIYN